MGEREIKCHVSLILRHRLFPVFAPEVGMQLKSLLESQRPSGGLAKALRAEWLQQLGRGGLRPRWGIAHLPTLVLDDAVCSEAAESGRPRRLELRKRKKKKSGKPHTCFTGSRFYIHRADR